MSSLGSLPWQQASSSLEGGASEGALKPLRYCNMLEIMEVILKSLYIYLQFCMNSLISLFDVKYISFFFFFPFPCCWNSVKKRIESVTYCLKKETLNSWNKNKQKTTINSFLVMHTVCENKVTPRFIYVQMDCKHVQATKQCEQHRELSRSVCRLCIALFVSRLLIVIRC